MGIHALRIDLISRPTFSGRNVRDADDREQTLRVYPAQEIIGSVASKANSRAKFVDMTPWLNGPFKSTDIVCRLPVFWWVRIAKMMEFLGGSVVVIQIVGER